jgi:tetratricopeptide (TPR) repeat protein
MPEPAGPEQDLLGLEARIARRRNTPSAREELSEALPQRAFRLQTLDRLEEAVAAYGELAATFITPSEDSIRRDVVRALQQRGHVLDALGRDAKAEASLRQAAAMGDVARPTVEQLHRDLERASDFERDGRYDEALIVLGDIIRPWGHAPPEDAAELVAYATVLLAQTAVRAGPNIDAALGTCEQVVESYSASTDPAVRAIVVWALTTQGWVHACAKRCDDAAESCARAIAYAGEHEDPRIRERLEDARTQRERWIAATSHPST